MLSEKESEDLNTTLELCEEAKKIRMQAEESDRIFGTYHPDTIEIRCQYLRLFVDAIINSNEPGKYLVNSAKGAFIDLANNGHENIIGLTKRTNHPRIQNLREDI